MKKITLGIALSIMLSISSNGQTPFTSVLSKGVTDVNSSTMVDGKSVPGTKQFYYKLLSGTSLTMKYDVTSYTLNRVRVYEYPNTELYNDFRTKGDETEMMIPRDGIYVVEFENNGISKRMVNYEISVTNPDNMPSYDTKVSFKTVFDTINGASSLGKVIYLDSSFVDVLDQKVLVNSQSNLTSPPTAIVAFNLPDNAIKYSYYIGVSQEGVEEYKKSVNDLANSSATMLASVDPLIGLLLTGVSSIGTLTGGEDIQYYLVENTPWNGNSNLFMAGQPFTSIRNSKVYNDASVVDKINSRNLAFCLYNDNMVQSVDVYIKVKAICAVPKTVIEKSIPVFH